MEIFEDAIDCTGEGENDLSSCPRTNSIGCRSIDILPSPRKEQQWLIRALLVLLPEAVKPLGPYLVRLVFNGLRDSFSSYKSAGSKVK